MDIQEYTLPQLTKFMRKQGILSIKTPQLELTLSPAALFPEQSKASESFEAPTQSPTNTQPELTEEQILFFSVNDAASSEG